MSNQSSNHLFSERAQVRPNKRSPRCSPIGSPYKHEWITNLSRRNSDETQEETRAARADHGLNRINDPDSKSGSFSALCRTRNSARARASRERERERSEEEWSVRAGQLISIPSRSEGNSSNYLRKLSSFFYCIQFICSWSSYCGSKMYCFAGVGVAGSCRLVYYSCWCKMFEFARILALFTSPAWCLLDDEMLLEDGIPEFLSFQD